MQKTHTICTGVAIVLLIVAPPTQRIATGVQDSYESRLAEARTLLDQRRLDDALEPLRTALQMRPDGPEALWLIGVVSLELQRLNEGLPHVRRLVDLAPDEVQPRLLLAAYYELSGLPNSAVMQYREVLRRDATHHEALLSLGGLAMRMADEATARQVLISLVEAHPEDPQGHVLLGRLHAQSGARGEALQAFRRAEELAPDSAEVHYLLGVLYAEAGRRDLARQQLQKSLRLQPENGPTVFQLGLLAAEEERADEALQLFERAARQMPEDARAFFRLGEAQQYLREMTQAEAAYRTALRLDPNLAGPRLQLGILYLETARPAEALAELRQAAELEPANPQIHYHLGQASVAVGDDDARLHYETALELDPFLTRAYLALGNLLMRRGETESGRERLTRFQQLQRSDEEIEAQLVELAERPDDPAPRRALIRRLLTEQRHLQALDAALSWILYRPELCGDLSMAYEQPLPGANDEYSLLLGLGSLLVECGEAGQAVLRLERARKIGPVSFDLLRTLARAYDLSGQPELAARTRAAAAALQTPR